MRMGWPRRQTCQLDGNGRSCPSAPEPVDKHAASLCMARARLSTGPAQPAGCGEPRKIKKTSACPTRSVAVFAFTSPNAASFLATASHGVVKIGRDVGPVSNFGSKPKPKMTTIQEVKLFLTAS